jgi:hypothetical protein
VSRLHISGSIGDKSFGILVRKKLASHDVALDRMRSRGYEDKQSRKSATEICLISRAESLWTNQNKNLQHQQWHQKNKEGTGRLSESVPTEKIGSTTK